MSDIDFKSRNDILVSIIIPIFNTERWLHRCLDSVIGQTYRNIEILLVDDGSTDNSAAICDEYAATDERIRVFHRANNGSSLSRKFAWERASGDYFLMVDSDDWIEREMVEKLLGLAVAEKLDIVWCDALVLKEGTQHIKTVKFNSDPSMMLKYIYIGTQFAWLWNKLIHRSFFGGIIAPEESVMEDVVITTQLMFMNPRMGYFPEPLYNYNNSDHESLTHSYDCDYKSLINLVLCHDYLVAHNCPEEYNRLLDRWAMRLKINMIHNRQYSGRYSKVRSLFPTVHKRIKNYPLQMPYSLIYWIGFNFGACGRIFLSLYSKLRDFANKGKNRIKQ